MNTKHAIAELRETVDPAEIAWNWKIIANASRSNYQPRPQPLWLIEAIKAKEQRRDAAKARLWAREMTI